jgi:hypothetical protein
MWKTKFRRLFRSNWFKWVFIPAAIEVVIGLGIWMWVIVFGQDEATFKFWNWNTDSWQVM